MYQIKQIGRHCYFVYLLGHVSYSVLAFANEKRTNVFLLFLFQLLRTLARVRPMYVVWAKMK